MTPGPGDRSQNELAQLPRKMRQIFCAQPAQIGRIGDLLEEAVHQCVRAVIQSASSSSRRAGRPKVDTAARAS